MHLKTISLKTSLLILIFFFTGILAIYAEQHSHFMDDDYAHFMLAKKLFFLDFLLTPIDVHFVPLHRLFSYLISQLCPLSFPIAILILLFFHIMALVYLYKLLQTLNKSNFNLILISIYASNVYLIFPLLWWSSGIHRFPYIFLTITCIYFYLQYRCTCSKKHLIIVFITFLLSFGFYSKAVLIPVYILGLELSLIRQTKRKQLYTNFKIILSLFLIALLYIVWYIYATKTSISQFISPNILFTLEIIKTNFLFFLQSPFAIIYNPDNNIINFLIPLIWVVVCSYTIIKAPFNALVWFVISLILGLNFLIIAISQRASFGIYIAYSCRYYYELMFLFIIFFCIIYNNFTEQLGLSELKKRFLRFCSRKSYLLIVVFVIMYMLFFFHSAQQKISTNYYKHLKTAYFMNNFLSGIKTIHSASLSSNKLSFIDRLIPKYIYNRFFFSMNPLHYSNFFQMYGLTACYNVPTSDLYDVDDMGHIRKVKMLQHFELSLPNSNLNYQSKGLF